MARVLVACLADLRSDPRPHRVLALLAGRHEVAALGYGAPPGTPLFPLPPERTPAEKARNVALLAARRHGRYLRTLLPEPVAERVRAWRPQAVVCHDLVLLPPLREALPGVPVVADLREFYPRHFEHDPVWRFLFQGLNERLCREELPRVARAWTVSPGLRAAYRDQYGVACRLVPSLPFHAGLRPQPVAPDGPLRLVHHGIANPARHLEGMVDAAGLAGPAVRLDMMLVPQNRRYHGRLVARARRHPNVQVVAPVPMADIVTALNGHDLGFFLCPDTTFNLRHCLPNKLFEFVQARLGVVIGPSPDMAAFVDRYGLGVVARSFRPEDVARELASLTPGDVARFKAHAHAAARELSFESYNAPAILADVEATLPA